MRFLLKHDVVGRRITGIYQTDYLIEPDGFGGCRVFVELDSTIAIELEFVEPDERFPLKSIDLADFKLRRCANPSILRCHGDVVADVLESEFWPTIGLSTVSRLFVYMAANPNPGFSGGMLTEPRAEPIGATYSLNDTWSCTWE